MLFNGGTGVRSCLALWVLIGSTVGQAQNMWDEYKHLDLYLSDADHEFMVGVQSRAEAWGSKGDAQLYEGFRRPLSMDNVEYKDSLLTLPCDSWRLEVLLSRTYDTLTVLALTRNVHYRVMAGADRRELVDREREPN